MVLRFHGIFVMVALLDPPIKWISKQNKTLFGCWFEYIYFRHAFTCFTFSDLLLRTHTSPIPCLLLPISPNYSLSFHGLARGAVGLAFTPPPHLRRFWRLREPLYRVGVTFRRLPAGGGYHTTRHGVTRTRHDGGHFYTLLPPLSPPLTPAAWRWRSSRHCARGAGASAFMLWEAFRRSAHHGGRGLG